MFESMYQAHGVGLAAARTIGAARGRTAAVLALDADNRVRPALVQGAALITAGEADIVHGPWHRFGTDRRSTPPPAPRSAGVGYGRPP